MKKTVTLIAIGILSLTFVGTVMSDSRQWRGDDGGSHKESESRESRGAWDGKRADVPPVNNPLYASECGACHFAYQPGLLPAADWQRIMNSLTRHFGDDASLDAAQAAQLQDYLLANAADRSGGRRSRAFAVGSGAASTAQPRITEARYFRREHDEIPARLVTGNTDVRSFSNCQACHRGANGGVFDEDGVNIPGHGRVDD